MNSPVGQSSFCCHAVYMYVVLLLLYFSRDIVRRRSSVIKLDTFIFKSGVVNSAEFDRELSISLNCHYC